MTIRLLIGALALALLAGCGRGGEHHAQNEQGHGEHDEHDEAEAAPKGSHGGRLLEKSGYAVELAIAESGTPPKFQAWFYRGGKPLAPSAGTIEVTVKRLDSTQTHS